jgi:hypothetical protein
METLGYSLIKCKSSELERISDILSAIEDVKDSNLLDFLKVPRLLQALEKLKTHKDNNISCKANRLIEKWKTLEPGKNKSLTHGLRTKSSREIKKPESFKCDDFDKRRPKIKNAVIKPSKILIYPETKPIPNRNHVGELVFLDYPNFRPNLTPKEVLQVKITKTMFIIIII